MNDEIKETITDKIYSMSSLLSTLNNVNATYSTDALRALMEKAVVKLDVLIEGVN